MTDARIITAAVVTIGERSDGEQLLVISNSIRCDEKEFSFNKDADMFVCPSGHMAIHKAIHGKSNVGKNQCITYYFDIEQCKNCLQTGNCYKAGAKNSKLKHRHGYDTASSSGLIGMELQGATIIFITNLKRILKLVDKNKGYSVLIFELFVN